MTSKEEALAAYDAAQPKVDAALEAIRNDDENWKEKAADALPAMRAFNDAVRDLAEELLGVRVPSEPQDPDVVVNGIQRDLGQNGNGRKKRLRWWPW